ncbi:MAG: aminotransferase class I/II-fold pyridoxal phosphate-dependent enzyme [Dehalococcoidia bacterium]|nr:aminotransferase class I/II-fold pyridoxal phosphate-dependent enzyme [Dehalococcoidia bacterium]
MARVNPAPQKSRFVLGWRPPRTIEDAPQLVLDGLSHRARTILADAQATGNYMTYREAINILGWEANEIYKDGRIALDIEDWADLGWLAAHIGPPESALKAMAEATTAENVGPYSPDLLAELRDLAAAKLERARSDDFEVMGTEGAQAGIAYALQTLVNPGEEVIITDPGYFHFVPALELAGGVPVRVELGQHNGYRLQPDELERAITPRTKVVMVCDPVNPYGTVQSEDELLGIIEVARKAGAFVIDDVTHHSHRIDPTAQQIPMPALHDKTDTTHVLATFGLSHGYGMAGARVGFLAGHPSLIRAALAVKIGLTRLNTNLVAQVGAIAALKDEAYIARSEDLYRRNLGHLTATVEQIPGLEIPVLPQYGYSLVIDVSGTGVTAQELTVSMFKRKVAIYPGDGLGDVRCTDYIRLNFSHPHLWAFERFREALPEAIEEARSGLYRDKIIAFFERSDTDRGRRIIQRLREPPSP